MTPFLQNKGYLRNLDASKGLNEIIPKNIKKLHHKPEAI